MMIKKRIFFLVVPCFITYMLFPLNPQVDTHLPIFENQSESDYGVYLGLDDNILFLLAGKSSFNAINLPNFKMHISGATRLNFISRSEEFPSLYFEFGGYASGRCPDGYEGPFFVSVWSGNADIPETEKMVYRYCQKKETEAGLLGFRIKPDGVPEVFATSNTQIISSYTIDKMSKQKKVSE